MPQALSALLEFISICSFHLLSGIIVLLGLGAWEGRRCTLLFINSLNACFKLKPTPHAGSHRNNIKTNCFPVFCYRCQPDLNLLFLFGWGPSILEISSGNLFPTAPKTLPTPPSPSKFGEPSSIGDIQMERPPCTLPAKLQCKQRVCLISQQAASLRPAMPGPVLSPTRTWAHLISSNPPNKPADVLSSSAKGAAESGREVQRPAQGRTAPPLQATPLQVAPTVPAAPPTSPGPHRTGAGSASEGNCTAATHPDRLPEDKGASLRCCSRASAPLPSVT